MKCCYDCGSTIRNHHTALCADRRARSKRDLPAIAGTQWWTGTRDENGAYVEPAKRPTSLPTVQQPETMT
jgi:hypothetical protein